MLVAAAQTLLAALTTSVDLAELRPRLARGERQLPAWVLPRGFESWCVESSLSRELVRHPQVRQPPPRLPTNVYRAWLDAELTAKLDLLTERGGFRNTRRDAAGAAGRCERRRRQRVSEGERCRGSGRVESPPRGDRPQHQPDRQGPERRRRQRRRPQTFSLSTRH